MTHTNFSARFVVVKSDCGHMGKTDVERHIGKQMHKSNAKSMKSQSTLNFQPLSSTIFEKVVI